MMKRIIVIGCPGGGKTTFAEKLSDKTAIPLYYLDAIWHKPDKTHISRDDFDSRLSEILEQDAWIIDGNYQRTLDHRMNACDTVILFDLPAEVCLEGATSRLGKERYDLPWIDRELDPKLKYEIESFSDRNLPIIYELISRYEKNKTIVIFKSREEANSFIENI